MVETATMLTVMFILAGALAPIVSESVDTARTVKAANDAKMIAAGMIQFERDLGPSAIAISYGGGSNGSAAQIAAGRPSIPEVLVSAGAEPVVEDQDESSSPDPRQQFALNRPAQFAARSSRGMRRAWIEKATGYLEDHLTTNRATYRLKRPGDVTGWNGPYLSALIKSDPWGKRYSINCECMDGGASAADERGAARRAVFVLSPGGNGILDTPFDQPIDDARLFGDDIGVRLR